MAQRKVPYGGPQHTIRRDRYGRIIDDRGNVMPPDATGTDRSVMPAEGGGRYTGGNPPGSSYGTPDRAVRTGGLQSSDPIQERQRQRVRALTSEEEAATLGAPGSGGLPDATHAGDPRLQGHLGGGSQQEQISPYDDYMQSYMQDLAGSYDAQKEAIGGLGPIFQQQASRSQENIGGFFDYAGDVAREGMPVTEETYDTAIGNVNQVYDQLGGRLEQMPQQMVDIASQAAGSSVGGTVAGRVAEATAPFVGAGETARANAVSNLTQHSAAGQNYLNQLASSTGAEAGMHQSAIEDSLNQQMQQIAYRQAEIEGAKQRALAEVSADVAGESSERMANAALSQALGLDLPSMVDPMDYMRGQGMQQDMGMGELQQQEAMLNLAKEQDPSFEFKQRQQQAMEGLSPSAQGALQQVQRIAETNFQEGDDPKNLGLHMLRVLDDMANAAGGGQWEGQGTELEGQLTGDIPAVVGSPAARAEMERAIRQLTGIR